MHMPGTVQIQPQHGADQHTDNASVGHKRHVAFRILIQDFLYNRIGAFLHIQHTFPLGNRCRGRACKKIFPFFGIFFLDIFAVHVFPDTEAHLLQRIRCLRFKPLHLTDDLRGGSGAFQAAGINRLQRDIPEKFCRLFSLFDSFLIQKNIRPALKTHCVVVIRFSVTNQIQFSHETPPFAALDSSLPLPNYFS